LRSPNSAANQQDARDSESGRPASHDPHLILEICRGRTEHPLRPVQSPRFLIGSSPRCDLRLGGAEIPPLLALIVCDGSDIWLEAMAAEPALRVNGRVETSVRIADGDRISLGPIELMAHVPDAAALPATGGEALDFEFEREQDETDVSELSAAELVERIEAATDMVNEFEERQRLGIEALQAAIAGREVSSAPAEPSNNSVLPIVGLGGQSASRPLVDLETLVVQLSGVVAELEKRTGAERRREAGYLDAVSTLFETQDRLARQLEILLRRVASLNGERSSGHGQDRAIA
jgi:hypothetical protein